MCEHVWIVDTKVMVPSTKPRPDDLPLTPELKDGEFLMRKVCVHCGQVSYEKAVAVSNKLFLDEYYKHYDEVYDKYMPGYWLDFHKLEESDA